MLLYALYASAFLYVTNTALERHYNVREEAIFADVIRNISRVNNVLQELISNYEQLQKLYRSQEKLEDDYSSDTEIDEVFKSMKKAKHDYKKKSQRVNPTDRPTNGLFPATQMIWSEDEDDGDMSLDRDQIEIPKAPKSQGLQNAKDAINGDDIENSPSQSMEIYNTTAPRPKGAKIIFIDTHKKIEEMNETKKPQLNKLPTVEAKKNDHTENIKTRYNKVKNEKKNDKVEKSKVFNTDLILRKGNNTKNIKKIVYSETFSPKNIWNDIIKNKPIQLQPHKDINYETAQNRAGYKVQPILRSAKGNTALVIVTNNKQKATNVKDRDTFESPEDDTIAKEIFKTKVLRHAYGDACMKVVMKKCYKACKQAGKAYCQMYKCKGSFRSKFKEESKTGCLVQFQLRKKNKTKSFRGHDMPDEFIDGTRGGFLDAACYPHTESESTYKPIILRNDTPPVKVNPITKYNRAIHILRDKYERACKKESAKKCLTACSNAAINTCSTFNCSKDKKKKFKNYCKSKCNLAYKVSRDSDSDSDSDYDSSYSDSDSSSDTDTS